MYNLKFAFCLLCFCLSIGTAAAQNNVKADKMYQKLGYKEAIKLYESKDKLSIEDMERIANGYRLNHDTENAALWYEQVVGQSAKAINYLYFAQALQSNGAYEKAKKYFLLYNDLLGSQSGDQRGAYLAAAIDRMNEWDNEEEVVLKAETSINSVNLDFSPSFYNEGIVFVSSRKLSDNTKYKWTGDHFMNLFYASANKDGELTSVESFSKMINSKYHEGPVAFNKSFDRIFFTRNDHINGKVKTNKKGVMKLGIFTALRDGEKWTEPRAVNFNTVEYEECHPALTADGKYLYFSSNREGGAGGMDIYVSEFIAGRWGEPQNLGPQINTPGNDVFPFVHDDGTLYFASDGWGGMGGLDIFYCKKDESNQWMLAANMGHPYNSRKDDFGFILNVLGTEGYLNSSREGGKGKDDIYSVKRSQATLEVSKVEPAIPAKVEDKEVVVDAVKNNNPTPVEVDIKMTIEMVDHNKSDNPNTIILIVDEEGKLKSTTSTDEDHVFIVEKEAPTATSKPIPTLENMLVKKRVAVGESFELKNVYFHFDDRDINKKGAKELDRLIKYMEENPSIEIELSAHTDSRGRTRYNKWLSRKRAESTAKYLVDRGIGASRIVAKGYGETKLRNNCEDGVDCEEKEHKINRRTEIKILKK